jgi:hypothetical protein
MLMFSPDKMKLMQALGAMPVAMPGGDGGLGMPQMPNRQMNIDPMAPGPGQGMQHPGVPSGHPILDDRMDGRMFGPQGQTAEPTPHDDPFGIDPRTDRLMQHDRLMRSINPNR